MSNRDGLDLQAPNIIKQAYTKHSPFWADVQKRNSLALFHHAAEKVPAYKNFLRKNRIDPKQNKNFCRFGASPASQQKKLFAKLPFARFNLAKRFLTPNGFYRHLRFNRTTVFFPAR